MAGRLAALLARLPRPLRQWVNPFRFLDGKPLERQLLIYELPQAQLALANDLEVVNTLLLDRAGTFPKSSVLECLLRPLIGAGVFGQAGGDPVRQARRIYVRALGRIPEAEVSRLAHLLTRQYLAEWRQTGRPVPIPSELSRLAIDIVSQATLGTCFTPEESRRFVDLFFEYHQRANPLLLLLSPLDAVVRQAAIDRMGLAAIGAQMRALIRSRFLEPLLTEASCLRKAPFAAALLEQPGLPAGQGPALADDAGRQAAMLDEIAVMLLAGHETTASVLAWLLWEVSALPDEQELTAQALTDADATPEGRGAMAPDEAASAGKQRLGALIQESLRLYPPIAFLLRENTEEAVFREKPIRAGSFVVVSPWTIQRHRTRWQNPDAFEPARWLTGTPPPAMAHRSAFIPFGQGPRVCPGKRFAELEMHAILFELLRACRFSRSRGRSPEPLGTLTSRPSRDFLLVAAPREPGPGMSAPLPPCPITGRPAKRRVHGVSASALAGMWRFAGAGDVSGLLPCGRQVVLYESDTGLYFFEPRVAGDGDFYRRLYASHGIHALLSARPHGRTEYRQAARHIPEGSRVLDVGCGNGELGEYLANCTYRGLDPYAGPQASAAVLRESVEQHLASARGAYDVVTAFQVIEHVANPRAFAGQLVDLLRPGGILILAAPLHPSPLTEIPNLLLNAPPHHLSWWNLGAFAALARTLGLSPVELAELPYSPHEAIICWMRRFSLMRSTSAADERYLAHRWSWHLNLIVSYLLARLANRWLPPPASGRASNVLLIARKPFS